MDRAALLYEREELMKDLLNVEDINLIKKFRSMLNKEIEKLPADMTIDELKVEVRESVKQVKEGKVISHKEVFTKYGL